MMAGKPGRGATLVWGSEPLRLGKEKSVAPPKTILLIWKLYPISPPNRAPRERVSGSPGTAAAVAIAAPPGTVVQAEIVGSQKPGVAPRLVARSIHPYPATSLGA